MENLEQRIKVIEKIDAEDIEYYQGVIKKKERINNPVPKVTQREKILMEFNAEIEEIPLKRIKKEKSKESWTKFLTEEESKKLIHLDTSSDEYKRIRNTCYIRRYYTDPENLKLQYARNKKYSLEKKLEKSEELKENMASILEERKRKLEEARKTRNEKSIAYYHKIKNDPGFKKREKEKNEKYRTEHKGYRKINYRLHKEGIIPMSEKSLERKEKIKRTLKDYQLLSEFKKDFPTDYNFIRFYGILDEMFSGLQDYDIKKMKKAIEKGGLSILDPKSLARKEEIKENLKNYKFLSDFRREKTKDYQWVSSKGLAEELYCNFYDYNRRKKNIEEKEDINDPDIKMFRKCRRNADKCRNMEEFKVRFATSYEFAVSKKMIDELEKLFKK